MSTLLVYHFKLSRDQCHKTNQDKPQMVRMPYVNAIGRIIYVMVCTIPNLAYAINVISTFMANPEKLHWQEVKWVLSYLNRHLRWA